MKDNLKLKDLFTKLVAWIKNKFTEQDAKIAANKYTLPQATEDSLGGVKIQNSFDAGAQLRSDGKDVPTINYIIGREHAFTPNFVTKNEFNSKVIPATENDTGLVKIHEEQASEYYNKYKNVAAGMSYVEEEIGMVGDFLRLGLESKQNKIKQVTSIPTAETTARDPDGTIYAVISEDGQQGGAVGALTMEDVESMGLPLANSYVYQLEKSNKYMLMKDFTLKGCTRSDVLEPGFYAKNRNNSDYDAYNLSNDIGRSKFQYYDGAKFVQKTISGSKLFFEVFRDGGLRIDYRDISPIDGIIIQDYAETTNKSSLMSSYNYAVAVNGMLFKGIDENTVFPGILLISSSSVSDIDRFTTVYDMSFLESVKKNKSSGETTYGYRKIYFDSNTSAYKNTAQCFLSNYHQKSPIYVKNGGSVEPPQSLYIKRNGKIIKL